MFVIKALALESTRNVDDLKDQYFPSTVLFHVLEIVTWEYHMCHASENLAVTSIVFNSPQKNRKIVFLACPYSMATPSS